MARRRPRGRFVFRSREEPQADGARATCNTEIVVLGATDAPRSRTEARVGAVIEPESQRAGEPES